MSNYVKSTDFAAKDALASGNAAKIVKGTEIDTEFNNIATAVATKADLASPTFTGTPTLPTGTIAVTQTYGDNSTKLATTAFVQAALQIIYPVGSIYTNASASTNPGTLFGFGTWTAFGAGRVMVGLDAGNALFDTAEETGGSPDAITVSHTHSGTTANGGSASGSFRIENRDNSVAAATNGSGIVSLGSGGSVGGSSLQGSGSNTGTTSVTTSVPDHTHTFTTGSTGSSGTNANYQPYITVYMWKRTA
ncbi:hypothetical protein EBT31_05615 [bacterium]|nr:hypothetical protein [bacterium]